MIKINRTYDNVIDQACRDHNVDPALVKAIIKQESNFNPDAHNKTSREDSYGLGQIQLYVAKNLGFKGDSRELFNPLVNIKYMCLLINDIKKRYSSLPDIIATYNAGKVRIKDSGYTNTSYVFRVLGNYFVYKTDILGRFIT